MKTFRYLRLLVLLALGAGVTASAAFAYGPKPKCPSGMDLVAKFEWKGSGYDFEKPSGNEGLVSLSGDAESASWTSQVDIDVVVLKGAKDSDVIATTDPRAGSFTNENLETPSGQQADISNVQFCAGETPPPPPPGGDCVECGLGANDADKVGELTLRYMGPDGLVEVYDNNKVGSRDLLFSEWLETGDEFTVRASAIGKDSFKSKIGFYVDGEEVAELHTSCSAPIVAGLTEATQPKAENPNGTVDVEIVGGKDKQGRELCDGDTPPPPPPPPGDDCVECGFGADDADKVSELTFEYSGTAGTVRVYDNDKTEAGDLLFEGFLNPGDTFTIMASTIGEDSFSSKVGFYLDGTSDSDKIAEIHTSCSSPVGFGTTEANQPKGEDPNGSVDVTVLSGKDKQGRELCDIPPPPPPGDDCVECGFGANDASRISELTLRYLGPEAYITVYDHKVSNGDVLFEGVLSPGEVFTVYASTIGEDRIGPKILLFAGDVQLAEIHTSCSAPVTAGLTEQTQPKAKDPNGVADFEIAGGRDSQGRLLCGSDICLADQGPPQISYAFDENSEGSFVVVTVTDDTGIASVDIEVEDIAGGTPNLELVEEDFTEGAMEATFRYQLINFTQNSYIRVVATDLCDQQQCPDTGEAPMDPPAGSITGFGDYATGYVTHPDGLYNLEFFRLVNVEVTQNTFEPGVVRADFRVDRLDHTQPTAYGFIAASACNATVIDPDISDSYPNEESNAFQETGGLVVVEAEHNTGSAEGYGGGEYFDWEPIGSYDGSSGDALRATPNVGANAYDTDRGPRLDYAVNFETPGTYYLWVRLSGRNGSDNSVHVGLDEEPATYGREGLDFYANNDWQWANRVNGRSGSDRVRVEVESPGLHTINLWMREDGTRIDKLVMTTNRYFEPNGTGPAESVRGGGGTEETASPIYVNFQQSSTATPVGYFADAGDAFGDRGNDQSFGWSAPNYETRERGATEEKTYDTLNHMQKNGTNKSWEVALPNGEYQVRLVMGDPSFTDQVNTISVEGVVAVDSDGQDNFDEHNLTVFVNDGRLTISPTEGSSNAKLTFVEIVPVGGGSARGATQGTTETAAARGAETEEGTALPTEFAVGQNYPNPFNATTTIEVELPTETEVRIEVYNLLGQRVRILADGSHEAGKHAFRFDASGLASGTYIYRVVTPEKSVTRRMVLVN